MKRLPWSAQHFISFLTGLCALGVGSILGTRFGCVAPPVTTFVVWSAYFAYLTHEDKKGDQTEAKNSAKSEDGSSEK